MHSAGVHSADGAVLHSLAVPVCPHHAAGRPAAGQKAHWHESEGTLESWRAGGFLEDKPTAALPPGGRAQRCLPG